MCEAISAATIAWASLATAAVGAYAAYDAGQTQNEFAKYEANQGAADARAEKGAAEVEAARIQRMGKMAAAEAGVAVAGSGQTLGSTGALAINRDIYRGAEEDAYFALVGGRDRSARMQAQSMLTRERGAAGARAANISAFSTIAQGAYSGWRINRTATAGSGGVGTG